MTHDDQQLIRQITEQVMAVLQQESVGGGRGHAASIRPPAGVCTGDYSKFTEMKRGGANSANGNHSTPKSNPTLPGGASCESPAVTLKGFVTARRLQDAKAKVIALGPGAKLTPAGADYVRENDIKIQRLTKASCACGGPCCDEKKKNTNGAATNHGRLAFWIDGHCEAVNQIAAQLRESMSPIAAPRQTSGLVEACTTLARRIASGQTSGGVLFVRSAALAACFANRCKSIRAVVGTCDGAVEQGVRQLDANVLIIETAQHGADAMRRLIETFTATPRGNNAAVLNQLRELDTCV